MSLRDRGSEQSQPLGLSVNYSPEFDDSEPNLSLLRRLAELGGGKILNPTTDSPFLHDRQKTFQPQDLRDWLLGFAILLFPLDVARAAAFRWIGSNGARRRRRCGAGFSSGRACRARRKPTIPWPPCSTGAARFAPGNRAQVEPPSPELFEPEKSFSATEGPQPAGSEKPAAGQPQADGKKPAPESTSTSSRLLEARRRAQRRSGRK